MSAQEARRKLAGEENGLSWESWGSSSLLCEHTAPLDLLQQSVHSVVGEEEEELSFHNAPTGYSSCELKPTSRS